MARRRGRRRARLVDGRLAAPPPRGAPRLRAAASATPPWGDDVELLVDGDQIFPCYLETIREAQRTVCMLTYAYFVPRPAFSDALEDAMLHAKALVLDGVWSSVGSVNFALQRSAAAVLKLARREL